MNKLALNGVHTALEFHEHHFVPFTLGQAMPSGVSARMLLIIVRALAFFYRSSLDMVTPHSKMTSM